MYFITTAAAMLLASILTLSSAAPTPLEPRQQGTVITFEGAGPNPPSYTLSPPFRGQNITISTLWTPLTLRAPTSSNSSWAEIIRCPSSTMIVNWTTNTLQITRSASRISASIMIKVSVASAVSMAVSRLSLGGAALTLGRRKSRHL